VSEQKTSIDIPQLLIKSGLVSTHDLSEAVQVSKRLQSPVSRILLDSGCFTETVLWMAVDLQHLMDEGLINQESAINSLKRVAAGKSSPDQVLDEIYSLPRFGAGSAGLAELLRASKIVTSEQLENALKDSKKTGSSLGSALILRGSLSAGFFPAILRLQEEIRKGMDVAKAAELLNEEYEVWQKAEESQRHAFQNESTVRSPQQDAGPVPHVTPGVPEPQHVPPRPLPPHLRSGRQTGSSFVPPPVPTMAHEPNSLTELMRAAGLISESEIQDVYQKALHDPVLAAKLFEAAGIVANKDLEKVLHCHERVLKNELSSTEAARVLKLSTEKNVPIDKILEEFGGWTEARAREERMRGAAKGFAAGCIAGVAGMAAWLLLDRSIRSRK
jgi:hypothetical protein